MNHSLRSELRDLGLDESHVADLARAHRRVSELEAQLDRRLATQALEMRRHLRELEAQTDRHLTEMQWKLDRNAERSDSWISGTFSNELRFFRFLYVVTYATAAWLIFR